MRSNSYGFYTRGVAASSLVRDVKKKLEVRKRIDIRKQECKGRWVITTD